MPAGSRMVASTRLVGVDINDVDRQADAHLNWAKKEGSETLFALAKETHA